MKEETVESIDVHVKVNDKTVVLVLFSSTVGFGISLLLAVLYAHSLITLLYGIVFGLTIGFICDYFILITHPLYTITAIKIPSDQSDELESFPSVMKLT